MRTIFVTNEETGERLAITAEQQAVLTRDGGTYAELLSPLFAIAKRDAGGSVFLTSGEFSFVLLAAGYAWFGR